MTRLEAPPEPSRIRSLAADPVSRRIATAALVNATGTGLFLASSLVYFTRYVGLAVPAVAAGLAGAALVGLVTTVPLGAVADRWGIRRTYLLLQALLATGYVVYAVASGFTVFFVAAALASIGTGASGPLLQALIARSVPAADRVRLMALTRSLNNVGYAVGGGLATIALAAATRVAFTALLVANAASFLIAAVLILGVPSAGTPPEAAAPHFARQARDRFALARNWRFTTLAAANGGLVLYSTLLTVGLPLWVLRDTDAPTWFIGPLFVLNTVLCVVLGVPLSRGADTLAGAGRTYLKSAASLCAGAALAGAAGWTHGAVASMVTLLCAMTFLSCGEVWQSAAQYGSSFALSPPGRESTYLATFSLGLAAQRIYGPLLVAAVIAAGGSGWGLLAAGFLAIGFVAAGLVRASQRSETAVSPEKIGSESI